MFDQILEDYLAQLTATGRSHAIRSDLTQFSTWWEHTHQRPFDLTQVVERDLRAWKVARQQVDGAAPATINRGLSTLRRLCTWAIEQKRLAENPTKDLTDIPSTPVSPRSLPDQAVDALLETIPIRGLTGRLVEKTSLKRDRTVRCSSFSWQAVCPRSGMVSLVGLIIEVTFIATLTQRFFNR